LALGNFLLLGLLLSLFVFNQVHGVDELFILLVLLDLDSWPNDNLFDLVAFLWLMNFVDNHWALWLFDQDVAPDLVSESLVVSVSKSEEGLIASWELWRGHLDVDGHSVSLLDLLFQNEWNTLEIISVSVDEDRVFWPGSLSVVSESPGLDEALVWQDFVLVTEAFLDESSVVDYNILLWLSLSPIATLLCSIVLADEFVRDLVWVSDLEKSVRMVDFCLTLFAKVEVRVHSALVSDTLDWVAVTIVTDDVLMDDLSLLLLLFLKEVNNHLSKVRLVFRSNLLSKVLVGLSHS
jgi:hypothetical protein